MRKDGLNVFNLWIGNFVLITMLTFTRFGFGVLNHGSYLWCRFICWTTCMLGTIYTYLIPLVLFFIPIQHMDVQNHVSTRMHIRIQVYLCLKEKWSGRWRSSHATNPPPKVMESMANCCWCGNCHSFESLDGIQLFYLVDWVSAILSTKVCVCVCVCVCFHLSFYFPLVNLVSGTFLLLKRHSHKVRRGIFQWTTNKIMVAFSFFFRVLKNFDQSPPWLWILQFVIKDQERMQEHPVVKTWRNFLWHIWRPILLSKHLFMTSILGTHEWHGDDPQKSHLSSFCTLHESLSLFLSLNLIRDSYFFGGELLKFCELLWETFGKVMFFRFRKLFPKCEMCLFSKCFFATFMKSKIEKKNIESHTQMSFL